MLDVRTIREDFPALHRLRHGRPPIYLDNAAGTIPPRQVIEAVRGFFEECPSCAGRSNHWFSNEATQRVYRARQTLARFLHCAVVDDTSLPDGTNQIAFVKNTTEGMNLVARGLFWMEGDVVVYDERCHNSNRTPWWDLHKTRGIVPVCVKRNGTDDPHAEFDVGYFLREVERVDREVGPVKVLSLTHAYNIDGHYLTNEVVKRVTTYAHSPERRRRGEEIIVMLDGAQSAPHKKIDVQDLDVDFLCFSVHKMLGPTGMGVVYMKDPHLLSEGWTPSGGGTVTRTFDDQFPLYAAPPRRYEAGLQHWSGIIGAGVAAEYLMQVDLDALYEHECRLNQIVTDGLREFEEEGVLLILGPRDVRQRSSICTIEVPVTDADRSAFDLEGDLLAHTDPVNIMYRTGDYCVHPFALRANVARMRASFYLYNIPEECEKFVEVLRPFFAERAAKGLTFERMREAPALV